MIISELQYIENISNEVNEIEGGTYYGSYAPSPYYAYWSDPGALPNTADAIANAFATGSGTATFAETFTETTPFSSASTAVSASVSA